ncbi:hypothetical protein B9Q13_00670 [Candidatus Marsarchaeota G2 archaeon ECH_B_SAG-G16]|jgi:hypothetical protein|uniref:Uncharacterized protein n=2 Tax=Candidatus Marsarchaeota TaxID=1978152 RepID=A0A2R6AIF2_9ARCH|nr:MAG: hypothetical protein B9Q00_10545 [Candidatus Marsarchaeota G1 archaeon OSP_C]PSO05815.1 MAG: hypothetical protein B9Q13_00670 [Candidatus Marsarchaeota G2 archaeon ECH_B_SAG-G16]
MRQPVETTTDIFAFFRNLNFIRNKKGFELKVLAVLLDAFGLSLSEGKTPCFFSLLSEPFSKSSVEDWAKMVVGNSALSRSHVSIQQLQ